MVRRVTAQGSSGGSVTVSGARAAKVVSALGGRLSRAVRGRGHRVSVVGVGAATLSIFMAAHAASSPPLGVDVTGTASAALSMGAAGQGTFTQAYTGTGTATIPALSANATGAVISPVTGTGAGTFADLSAAGEGSGNAFTGTGAVTLDLTAAGIGEHLSPTTGMGSSVLTLTAAAAGRADQLVAGMGAAVLALSGTGVGSGGAATQTGPHPTWNGQAGTGAAAPVDPVRTTAKPMASWWSPTLQRFTNDFIVGVIADAKGGIASVEFSGDCATTTATQASIRSYTDVNGRAKKTPLGYWLTLDHSAFVAVPADVNLCKINLYAKVTANDPTMQVRVIGGTNVDGSGNLIADAIPQQHYPRTAQYTWQATVDLAGAGRVGPDGRYTSYDAAFLALQAATTAQKRAPRITFVGSGVYPSAGFTFEEQVTQSEGYVDLDADPGITARITRGSSFDPLNSQPSYWKRSWYFLPGANQIRFGRGVVVDIKNFSTLIQTNNYQPYWFDGCGYTNSIGTLNHTYFNGGDHPGLNVYKGESNPVPCYMTDAAVSYVQPPWCFAYLNSTGRAPGAGVHNQIRLNVGNYERGATPEYQFYGPDRMTGTYVGSATTARCKVYGYDTGCKVELYENGAVVKTVTFPNLKTNRQYVTAAQAGTTVGPEPSALIAELNTRPGWTFSEIGDDTGWWSWAFNNGVTSDQNCKSVTATWQAGIDKHTEFLQQRVGGSNDENFIIWNNVIRDAFYSTSFFNDDYAQDVSLKFNVFDEGVLPSGDNSQWGLGKHLLIENNFIHDGVKTAHAVGQDAYSSFRQNITIGAPGKNSAGVWPSLPGYQDNLWVLSLAGAPAGTNDTGNLTAANAAAIYAAFTDRANADYRPASGVLTLNKKARLGTYDGRGNPIAATDCIGPWAEGYDAPEYPF